MIKKLPPPPTSTFVGPPAAPPPVIRVAEPELQPWQAVPKRDELSVAVPSAASGFDLSPTRKPPEIVEPGPRPAPAVSDMAQSPFGVEQLTARIAEYEKFGWLGRGRAASFGRELAGSTEPERKMLARALDELGLFGNRYTTAGQYFIRIQEHAAKLEPKDGRRFQQLVSMVYNQYYNGVGMQTERAIAGGGRHAFGHVIESIYGQMALGAGGSNEKTGFNRAIVDSGGDSNSISHHFGEFLNVGANRIKTLGFLAQDAIDGRENPGDVHNGYFATMLGDALTAGTLTPTEAVELSRWAITTPGSNAPFTLRHADYSIDRWKAAFAKAHAK